MGQEGKQIGDAPTGQPAGYWLGRLAWPGLMALACLHLALGGPPPHVVPVLVGVLWLWLAISFIGAVIGFVRRTIQENPLEHLLAGSRICFWTSVSLLVVASGALFAAGETALATAMELLLFMRLFIVFAADNSLGSGKDSELGNFFSGLNSLQIWLILMFATALWLALGPTPPDWATSMIVTWFWIFTLFTLFAGCLGVVALNYGPEVQERHRKTLRRNDALLFPDGQPSAPAVKPEPLKTPLQLASVWMRRAGWLIATWALWTAGLPLLAGLFLLGFVLALTLTTHGKRLFHGDAAKIDFFDRAVHFVVWWPVNNASRAMIAILSAGWNRIVGPAGPRMAWEREERTKRARIRRAAASYRLREAFGQPDGFVYFLYAESHQREHFLRPGGLLAGLGERVVARNWRKDVAPARKAAGWTRFQQTPEGALLRVNNIASMQKDMPFVAVAPSRGIVQVFPLGEPYRARRRDKGAALARAEVEVMATIEAILKPGAGGAGSC